MILNTPTSTFLTLGLFATSLLFAPAALAGPDLADYAGENAFLYLGVENVTRMKDRFEASPLKGFVDSGEFKKLMNSLSDGELGEGELSDAEKAELELLSLVRGDGALIISDLMPMIRKVQEEAKSGKVELPDDVLDPESAPDQLFEDLAGLDSDESLEALFDQMVVALVVEDEGDAFLKQQRMIAEMPDESKPEASYKVLERSIDGIDFFITEETIGDEKEEANFWTVEDGIAVEAFSETALVSFCRTIKAGGHEKPLSGSIGFARALARDDEADGIFYLNLKSLADFATVELEKAAMPEDSGLDGERMAAMLELGEIDPVYFTFRLADEGIRYKAGYGFANETRLAKVLMPYVDKAPERPNFVPANALTASSMRIDMSLFHDAVIDLMNNLNPQFGAMVPLVSLQLKGQIGLDYKKDLLDNMADSMIVAQFMDSDAAAKDPNNPLQGSGYLLAMGMKDRQSIERAIQTAISTMGVPEDDLMTKEDYLGHKLNMVNAAGEEGMEVGYAMIDDYLVLGFGNDILKSAIRTKQKPKTSIWNSEDFTRLVEELPSDASSIEYSNFQNLFQQLDILGASGLIPEEEGMPDFSALSRLFGNALRTNFKDGSHMQMDGILLYADDE